MSNYFPQYTTDYISGVMSLRTPQKDSLKILEDIVNSVTLRKGMNLKAALGAVHAMYPICSDFERDFMSLTFALATGVGKTRLMGAFIAYLYRKISKNGRLLNILLYILAMIGSAQTLQVLQTEFGIPFKISFWVVMGVFVIFGLIWLIREIKKR